MPRERATGTLRPARLDGVGHVGDTDAAAVFGKAMRIRDLGRCPVRLLDADGTAKHVRVGRIQNTLGAIDLQAR